MNDVPVGQYNELSQGVKCDCCKETSHYADELVFFLGKEMVSVSEQHPDWDKAICTTCAEEQGLI